MRASSVVVAAAGLRPFDHLGWAFENRAEFLRRTAEYLLDGLAAGQWTEYVGRGTADALRAELRGLPDLTDAVEDGRIAVTPIEDFYVYAGMSAVVDPKPSVARRAAAVEKALADGFTGFRAVVDCTDVARSARQRAAFGRFEYLLDQVMAVSPVSALCAYNLSKLGEAATAQMVCLHPHTDPVRSPFWLYADPDADFALSGTIDGSCTDLSIGAVGRAVELAEHPPLTIDARSVRSLDDGALIALDRIAGDHGRQAVLRGSAEAHRLAEQLALAHLRVETAPARVGEDPRGAGSPPLSDEVEFLLALRAVSTAFARFEVAASKAAYGVGPSEGATLAELFLDGPLTPTELAHRAKLTTAAMTEVLDKLERAGHVRRDRHPMDRRKVVVSLTPSAIKIMDREAPALLRPMSPILDALNATTREAVIRVLQRVVRVLEDETATRTAVASGD